MRIAPRWTVVLTCLLLALPARADQLAQARQVLEWSGALTLLEQAQPVAQLVLNDEQSRRAQTLSAAQQRELLQQLDARTLQQQLITRIAAQLPAQTLQQAQTALEQPLAKRVRFFERALTQPKVEAEWAQWREQTPPPSAQRLALLRAIDTAARDSRLVAQLQTDVERAVRRQLGIADNKLQTEASAEREHHLQSFTEQYLYYAYRYLRDEELQQYAQLLQDAALQQLFDQIAETMTTVIGENTR